VGNEWSNLGQGDRSCATWWTKKSGTIYKTTLTFKRIKLKKDVKVLRYEDVWESGIIDPRVLHLDTSWRWMVSFTVRPLCHWIGDWVVSRPLWMILRSLNSWSYRDSNFDPSVVQPLANPYTDCATAATPGSPSSRPAQSKYTRSSSSVFLYTCKPYDKQIIPSFPGFTLSEFKKVLSVLTLKWNAPKGLIRGKWRK
jgi:hypothetical protein